ncbi:uncharacterized protein LOC118182031 [Stegodyphus dumicola]|uniref:uncharacterized protein LOC118182031 n=1 Tax=Stegodyphus dumicola TaxID=202533 RepID=UPI0015AC3266|nr:uncharacterized protein LOC118182031 [Stegodyphus dumicola]
MKIPEDGNLPRITSSGPNPCKLVIVKVPDKFRKRGESVYQLSSLKRDTAGDEWPADKYTAKLFPGFYKERKKVKAKVNGKKMYTQNKHMASSRRRRHNQKKSWTRGSHIHGRKARSDKQEHQQNRSATDIEPWLNPEHIFQNSWNQPGVLQRIELDRSLNSSGETCIPLYSQPYNYPSNTNIYQNAALQLASNQMQQSLHGSNLSHNLHGSTSFNDLKGKHSVGLLGDAPSHIILSDRPSTSGYSAQSVDPLPVNSQFSNSYHRWENGHNSVSRPQHMANNQIRNDVDNSRREYYHGERRNFWKEPRDRNAMHGRPYRGKRNAYPRK